MNFKKMIIISVLVVPSMSAVAEQAHETACLQAIQAVDYAQTFKSALKPMCANSSYASMPICTKLAFIPRLKIERAALPYFLERLSQEQCQAAFDFYTSPLGESIKKKIFPSIESSSDPGFTDEEVMVLDEFNRSVAGLALGKLGRDRSVGRELVQKFNQ